MKNLFVKYASVIATIALMLTTVSVNRTCWIIMHQPKLPEGAEKLRKF